MKSIPTLTESDLARFWSKVDKRGPDDCWEWTAYTNPGGYGMFGIGKSVYLAHRVSYALANSDPGDLNVNHTCDNPPCVNPAHLWFGTQQENISDMIVKDRQIHAIGEDASRAILVEEDVIEILKSSLTHHELAEKYGVSIGAISGIFGTKNWKHLDKPPGRQKRLTEDTVRAIRLASKGSESQYQLAKKFRVSQPTIHEIIQRKTWKHLS